MLSSRQFSLAIMLRQLRDRETLTKIWHNKKTRLFDDLPEKFNCIYADIAMDTESLLAILTKIRPACVTDENTSDRPVFTNPNDIKQIQAWAMEIVQHACKELLSKSGHTKDVILATIGKTQVQLEGREIVYAFFAANTQQIIINIGVKLAENRVNEKVFKAFNLLLNESSRWIDQYLGLEEPVDDWRLDNQAENPFNDLAPIVALGVGVATGLLFFGAAIVTSCISHENNQNQKKKLNPEKKSGNKANNQEYFYSPPPSPDMLR
jgi:hypothetical protein